MTPTEEIIAQADYGKALRQARCAVGMTQRGVEQAAGLPLSSLSPLERGVVRPTAGMAAAIERALGLQAGRLRAPIRRARGGPRPSWADRTPIGERLYRARLRHGWTQARLGDAIGVSCQQVQKYETGANRIALERAAQIALALGERPGFLLEPEESELAAAA